MAIFIENLLTASDFRQAPFADLPITKDEWNPNRDSDSKILDEILGPKGNNWERMKKAHLAFAPVADAGGDPPTQRNAYKLKIARMRNGRLTVYFKQLASRMGIINGARGTGVNMPEMSKRESFSVGLQYYEKFDIPEEDRPAFTGRATVRNGTWYTVRCASHEEEEEERKAEIDLFGEIGGELGASDFVESLRALHGFSKLQINLSSAGGGVFEGLVMYNALLAFPGTVNITVQGLAASIGSIVAMGGSTLEMGEGSFLMLHDPVTLHGGGSSDLRKNADVLDKIKDQLVGIYHARSGIDRGELAQMMDAETWFNAEEAVAAGFADRVVEGLAVAAKLTDRNFSNMPIKARKFIMADKQNSEHTALADMLNSLIDGMVTDDRTRESIIDEMATGAGMSADDVNSILDGSVSCPVVEALESFANVLDTGVDTLMAAGIEDGCNYDTDGGDGDDSSDADDSANNANDGAGDGSGGDSGDRKKSPTAAAYEEGYDAGRAESTKGLKAEYQSAIGDHKSEASKALSAAADAHRAELSEAHVERDLVRAEHGRLKAAYGEQNRQLDHANKSLATYTKGLKIKTEDPEAVDRAGETWEAVFQAALDDGMKTENAILHCQKEYPKLHKEFIAKATAKTKHTD